MVSVSIANVAILTPEVTNAPPPPSPAAYGSLFAVQFTVELQFSVSIDNPWKDIDSLRQTYITAIVQSLGKLQLQAKLLNSPARYPLNFATVSCVSPVVQGSWIFFLLLCLSPPLFSFMRFPSSCLLPVKVRMGLLSCNALGVLNSPPCLPGAPIGDHKIRNTQSETYVQ